MSILTSVSDGLALLVSGAAMATAARALWLASRRSRSAAPAGTSTATSQPAPAPSTVTTARRTTTGGGTPGRGNQTREQVRAFLADPERAGSDWSLVQVSQGVGRSSATVSYALDKLVQAGEVELTSPKPRRYTITPGGTAAHQQQQQQAVQAERAAPPEPTPTQDRKATAQPQPRTRPAARKPASASTDGPASTASTGNGGTRGRGNQTREQVRAFLADPERAGSDWSLVQVSQGVGRSSATVSYTLDKLVQAGEVQLTSPKPRRYTIAASGDGPAEATGQPAEPTGDTTDDVSAPAVAAQARPGRTRGRPAAAAVEAEASKAPAMARAATTARKPKGSSGKATAAAATRKASTKPAAATAAK